MSVLPTVKVACKNEQGYMIINESDFDPKVHKKFGAKKVTKKKATKK